MPNAVAAVLFAAWLAVTVAAALGGPASAAIRRADALSLIPSWTFFAPNPGIFDYHLLARSRLASGETGRFVEIAPPASRLRRSLWNPERRIRKTIYDCSQELILLHGATREGAEYTLGYLTLLNLAVSRLALDGATSVQFIVVRSGAILKEPQLLVRSRFHPVSA